MSAARRAKKRVISEFAESPEFSAGLHFHLPLPQNYEQRNASVKGEGLMKIRMLALGLYALALSACGTTPEIPPGPPIEALITSEHYTPLERPSGHFAPGAVIRQMQDASGATYFERVSSITTCGATAEESAAPEGEIPAYSSSSSYDIKLSATFRALQQDIGANAQYIRAFSVKFGSGATAALDEFRLDAWRQRILGPAGDSLPAICRELVSETPTGLFIVRDAMLFRNGEYTIDVDASTGVSVPAIVSWLGSAGANFVYDGNTKLTFEGPVYYGIRRLYYAGGQPTRLGTQDVASASSIEVSGGLLRNGPQR